LDGSVTDVLSALDAPEARLLTYRLPRYVLEVVIVGFGER
jgi:hypothetical protein